MTKIHPYFLLFMCVKSKALLVFTYRNMLFEMSVDIISFLEYLSWTEAALKNINLKN